MEVIHADRPVRWDTSVPSLFLAGPPADPVSESWRTAAVHDLCRWGFRGQVIVPEFLVRIRDQPPPDPAWEEDAAARATVVAFWSPGGPTALGRTQARQLNRCVAGRREDCVYGRPDGSRWATSLDVWYRRQTGQRHCRTVEELLEIAVARSSLLYNHFRQK